MIKINEEKWRENGETLDKPCATSPNLKLALGLESPGNGLRSLHTDGVSLKPQSL